MISIKTAERWLEMLGNMGEIAAYNELEISLIMAEERGETEINMEIWDERPIE